MRATFATVNLTPTWREEISGLTIDGRYIVQLEQEAGANALALARGGRSTEVSFRLVRLFATEALAAVFMLGHLAELATNGVLILAVGDAPATQYQLADAALSSVRFGERTGVSVPVTYTFIASGIPETYSFG